MFQIQLTKEASLCQKSAPTHDVGVVGSWHTSVHLMLSASEGPVFILGRCVMSSGSAKEQSKIFKIPKYDRRRSHCQPTA